MQQVTLTIPNMSCGHCEMTVTETLTPIAGVQKVQVELPTHQVFVDFDESRVSVDQMSAALAAEDYPVEATA